MGSITRTGTVALCLVSAATAFVGIVHVEGQALRERPRTVSTAARDEAPIQSAAPTPLVAPAAPSVVAAPTVVPTTVPAAAPTEAPEANRVPSYIGLRLTYAERRIERRGWRVVAVDEDGNGVDLAEAEYYRVIRQSVRRGTTLAPGSVIEVRVRDRSSSYSDWG